MRRLLARVSSLQERWLDKQPSDDIAVFVVWSDQLFAGPRHVPEAAALMPDRRARHYWDGDRVVGRAYRDRLEAGGRRFELDSDAWDVWLLFDRDARWGEHAPPKPSWWEHQLGDRLPPERSLDPQRFAAKAAELLARRMQSPASPVRSAIEGRKEEVRHGIAASRSCSS